ncbi:hypothetical protein ACJ73_08460 [Blastomyces percursus]|uniref:DUF7924 domain-containing protein n=1 Tax=Blastomyces percursus TaxID=1658174 RepID=A0A1J9PV87_9EURO|nr:hypothetical protein ACJ73_08460 [Blastomyces percursus]
MPVFKLKDPRPDICVGLSDEVLADALEPKKGRGLARRFLLIHMSPTPLGLRFPFLMVEAKAGATGGNLYRAQNQAAVGGSAALQIFRRLSDLQYAQNSDQESSGNLEAGGHSPHTPSALTPYVSFSIAAEGPVHELRLHFRRCCEEDYYMGCIRTWRTTVESDSLDLLRHLWEVLRWGNDELKGAIIESLQAL